ncbi:hypothetical protein B0I37DRAFT_424384 [Chaetomium sp. MPI-CAGE-AT-0009]|nr:hypothetical protein B0I37DRAFT_424384 [Chaetomium sp. MPI-CAGE-AT-0009]
MPPSMRLRESSMRRVPGRYQEDIGPARAERPLFAHPDVPFNAELSRHCAHPSLPLDYPGVGPSEAERARLAALAIAEQEEEEEEEEESAERMTDEEDSWGVASSGQASSSGSDSDIPRRKPGQNSAARSDGSGDSIGGSTVRQKTEPKKKTHPKPTMMTNTYGIKYAIVCDMTRTAPLSRAVQSLDLDHVEATSLLGLVAEERKKKAQWAALLAQHPHSAETPSAEELAPLCPINEGITAGEVRRGRAFLKFLGMGGAAARLGFWEGTAGDFHEVQIDEGCRHLLLLRLDPPANTVNPLRLRPGAPLVRAKELELVRVPWSAGLHPMNYTIGGKSGRRYSTLDKSDWPDWEALHDAGVIPRSSLAVLTAHSLVPSEVTFLTEEEMEAINAADPVGMLGSATAPDLGIDYGEGFNSQHQPGRWVDQYPNAPRDWDAANPFEEDFPLDLFGDNDSESGTSVNRQQRRAETAAPADELVSSQTVAEDDDHEMAGVSTRPPVRRIPGPRTSVRLHPRLGPNRVHQSAPAPVEQRDLSEQDPIGAALSRLPAEQVRFSEDDPLATVLARLAKKKRPIVRQLDPEVAATIAQLQASFRRERPRVHFEDELPALPTPRPPVPVIEVEYPTDEEGSRSDESAGAPHSRRGPRARSADPDDDEYRPGARRSGTRAPKAGASGTRKRGRPASPVDRTPKRPRTGRGPGRPRKNPLPNPDLLAPPPMGSRGRITVRRSPAKPKTLHQSSEQTATPKHPTTAGAQNPSSAPIAGNNAALEPQDPFLDRPSAEPSIPANSVPQPPKRSRALKVSADEEEEEDEQAVKKRAPRKKRQPKLDENGEPIVPKRGRPRRSGPSFSCDGTKRMRSTVGEETTRAEFHEAFTRDELIYRPGGNFGGGTFEIKATGVIWSFLPPADYKPSEKATRRAKTLATADDTGTNASNNQAGADQQNAPTTPGTLNQASRQQTLIGTVLPNAPTQAALPRQQQPAVTAPTTPPSTTTATSASAPRVPATPPAPRKPAPDPEPPPNPAPRVRRFRAPTPSRRPPQRLPRLLLLLLLQPSQPRQTRAPSPSPQQQEEEPTRAWRLAWPSSMRNRVRKDAEE